MAKSATAISSLQRFQKLTTDLRFEVRDAAIKELNDQADGLVKQMISAAPYDKGNLQHSVRKIPGKSETQVRVMAGGQLTVRPSVSTKPYDYSRADEFGTRSMNAKPFFFPTYRLLKKKIISTMKRRITASIKKRSAE